MYAIVECGGKQYKVEKDMLVKVEKIDAEIGDVVELKTLMLVDDNGNVKSGRRRKRREGQCKSQRTRQIPQSLRFPLQSQEEHQKASRSSSTVYRVEDCFNRGLNDGQGQVLN